MRAIKAIQDDLEKIHYLLSNLVIEDKDKKHIIKHLKLLSEEFYVRWYFAGGN